MAGRHTLYTKFLVILALLCSGKSLWSQSSLKLTDRPRSDLDQGLYYYKIEKYEIAAVHFKNALSDASNIPAFDVPFAAYYLASSLFRSNDSQGAALLHRFTTQNPQHSLLPLAYYELGMHHATLKEYDKAVYYLSKVDLTMLDEEDKIECNFRLGYAHMNLKDFDKAGVVFQRLRNSKNKYTYSASYYLGYIHYKNELFDIALTHLKKATENQAYRNIAPALIGSIFLKTARYDTLLKFVETNLTNDQVKYKEDLMLLAAEGYYYTKDYSLAASKYSDYLALGFQLTNSHICKYGISLYASKDYNKSLTQLKKVAEFNDTLGQTAAYYLGLNWLKLENKSFAYNAFGQARKMSFSTELQTKSTLEYLKLAIQLKDFKEAIEIAKEAQNKFKWKDSDKLLIEDILADAYLNTHDPFTAYKYLEPIRNKTGNTARTYQLVTFYLGLEFFNQNKIEEALDYFQKSLDYEFDKETYYMTNFYMGECLMAQESYEEAIPFYVKVAKYSPRLKTDLVLANQLGLAYAYFNTQDYSKALAPLKELYQQENSLEKEVWCAASARLGDAYFATKSFPNAQMAYQKNLDKGCLYPDYILMQKGRVSASMNKSEEAKSVFMSVIQRFPQSAYTPDAWYNMALIDFENTKYAASIETFTKLIDQQVASSFVPMALQKRAIAYNNLKQYDKAVSDYQRLLKEFPSHKAVEGAVLGLQDALNKLGKSVQEDSALLAFKAINPQSTQLQKIAYEETKDLFFSQKYVETQKTATDFIESYPNSIYLNEVYYFAGDAAYRNKDTLTSLRLLRQAASYANGVYYKRATLRFAEVLVDVRKTDSALIVYRTLVKEASTPKEKYQALQGIQTAFMVSTQWDSSFYYVQQLISLGPVIPNMYYKALIYRYQIATRLQSVQLMDYILAAINELPDSYAAEAQYDFARLHYQNKKYAAALDVLFELSQRYKGQEKWLNKAYLLIADCYIAQNELYQAKATLVSIIEKSKEASSVEIAKQKLSQLETP